LFATSWREETRTGNAAVLNAVYLRYRAGEALKIREGRGMKNEEEWKKAKKLRRLSEVGRHDTLFCVVGS
jgi:hypothetical protein